MAAVMKREPKPKMVRWLSLPVLANSLGGLVLSKLFGDYAGKREVQPAIAQLGSVADPRLSENKKKQRRERDGNVKGEHTSHEAHRECGNDQCGGLNIHRYFSKA